MVFLASDLVSCMITNFIFRLKWKKIKILIEVLMILYYLTVKLLLVKGLNPKKMLGFFFAGFACILIEYGVWGLEDILNLINILVFLIFCFFNPLDSPKYID